MACVRCGNQAHAQWQVCADDQNYRPICKSCDYEINAFVLYYMKIPDAQKKLDAYQEKFNAAR